MQRKIRGLYTRHLTLLGTLALSMSMGGCLGVDSDAAERLDAATAVMDQGLAPQMDATAPTPGGDAGEPAPLPNTDGGTPDPSADGGGTPDARPSPSPDMGTPPPDGPLLFIVAGQSNAEGNAFYTGLELLSRELPMGDAPLSAAERDAARVLIARSQGGWCSAEDVRDNTADTVIDHLRTTDLDWRSFDLDYRHPSVRIRAQQYDYAPVIVRAASGEEVPRCEDCDEGDCLLSAEDGVLEGPPLNLYTDARWAPLAVGYGIAEDPEEGKSYGPELAFGHAVGQTYPDALLFKMAMGGSSLGDHWRLDGPLYAAFIEGISAALTEHGATLGGFVWFQGFNDQFESAYCEALTPAYQGNLQAFIEAVRRDLGQPVPTVIVKARNGGNLERIQRAQDAVAAALEQVETVETRDTSECFHYDSGAMIVIGERAAQAMLGLRAR